MPRPRQLFETGDPITADFTYIRWLGDRKAIEEITKVWNKLVIDREPEMEEWIPAMQKMLKRRLTIYAYFNNHYSGSAYGSARVFNEMWQGMSGTRGPQIARPPSARAQQTNLF
jgi:uncharacterized protein YecE (DUF72 family)